MYVDGSVDNYKVSTRDRGCCNYFNYFWHNATPFIETRLIRTKNGVTTNLKKDYMVEKSII